MSLRFLLPTLLCVGLVACFPTVDDGQQDAGGSGGVGGGAGGADGGSGGGSGDGGPDDGGGCSSCLCGEGGSVCPTGEVCVSDVCVPTCTEGDAVCDGVRIDTCVGGVWSGPERCGDTSLCMGDTCTPISSCASDSPPCCALPTDCGNPATPFSCPECREIIRNDFCIAGACEPEPTVRVDFTVRADARSLTQEDRILVNSGVVSIYRGTTSDGRSVDCPLLLAGGHDAMDPTYNATLSRHFEYTNGTGNDIFDARVLGVPEGTGQAIVVTIYDGDQGGGNRLARACVDGQTLTQDAVIVVTMVPWAG